MQKYRMVYQRLASEGLITPDNLFLPAFPERRDLLLVHTPEYLRDLENLAFSPRTMFSEIPLTRKIIKGYKLFAGGTILAGQKALEKGMAIHLGGGFHHAFPSRGEGFCYINDVAVSIRRLKRDKLIEKALIVDCDLHQGNGTAHFFGDEERVFTFSMHQERLYPKKE
ncbi:MAG: histone deacetylase, partial [Candidatus Aerophobus sp.]